MYTNESVYLAGQVYHCLLDILNPDGTNPYQGVEIHPYKYLFMVLPRVKSSKIPKKVENAIAKIMDNIDPEDMNDILSMAKPCPPDLRMSWWSGYELYRKLLYPNPIENIRKEKGMSQKELAEKAGVTQTDISRWENCFCKPNSDSLKKLSNALGCTIDELIE